MTPSAELPQRIAALFGRRLSTAWSEKEVRRYKRLVKDKCLTDVDQIELIERYYAFQRRKGENGTHRRDLYTFLNNFTGELDRARSWENGKRPEPKRYKATNGQRPCTDEEFQRIGQLARAELENFKAKINGKHP